MSFFIKENEIKEKVILAPMAGITSFSYRKFMSGFLDTLCYTEMVSDSGLIYGNKETTSIIYTDGSENLLSLQLFGSDKEKMVKAIKILEEKNIQYKFLDINLACPVTKVVKTGAGSFLLNDLDYLYDFMKTICEASSKPVTAKIRLGYKDINVEETVKVLEKAGVSFIAIHARTKDELYSGKPHFEELKNIHNIIKIPFGFSGNIFSVNEAKEALEITKADCVLLARGGVGNPELFKVINDNLNGKNTSCEPSISKQKAYLLKFTNMLIEEKGEKRAISLLKGIAPKFFTNFENSKSIRCKLSQEMNSKDDLINILDSYVI